MLAAVEQVHAGERAPVGAAADAHVRAARAGGLRKRQVLPEGAVGRAALRGEVGLQARALQAGVVVLDLVVVPHHQPRCGGMGGLQQRVALVEGVAVAVVGERDGGAAAMRAHASRHVGVLVDVVAEEKHEVQVLRGDVAPRGVVAVVEALATRDGELEARLGIGRRRGARAAGRAAVAKRAEAVPVPAPGLETGRLGMHAVRPLRLGALDAASGDAREGFVVGHLPCHVGAVRQVRAGEAGPEHHAVGPRVAGRNAEREALRRLRPGLADQRRPAERGADGKGVKQLAPIRHAAVSSTSAPRVRPI